ncbi:MAG: hypothetical protein NW220_06685 [Leptolyngbyaceae cyanobacterium bins.349]|nr:hypothetical protein [Leptolyngbyaceae cyanobacterium bins.349]
MSIDNLNFLDDGQSIASTVSQLHRYFKTTYSRYKIQRSDLVSKLESAESDEALSVKEELRELDQALALFGILTDSLSAANRVLHTETAAKAMGISAELYAVHLEDEAEQTAEREAAQRRIGNA